MIERILIQKEGGVPDRRQFRRGCCGRWAGDALLRLGPAFERSKLEERAHRRHTALKNESEGTKTGEREISTELEAANGDIEVLLVLDGLLHFFHGHFRRFDLIRFLRRLISP